MKTKTVNPKNRAIIATDLFCGVGGLTRGMMDAGIQVVAGFDIDDACRYPYEKNNGPAVFENRSVSDINGKDLKALYPADAVRVLVGCAPCQPFSKYTQGLETAVDEKWGLLTQFGRLVGELKPHVVSMENVPQLRRHSVYEEFLTTLRRLKYSISVHEVYCPDYGIPQQRTRLVLFASLLGPIQIIPPTHSPETYPDVKDAIGRLPRLKAGEVCQSDPLHRSSTLSYTNLLRIRESKPGGTWRDWPLDLVAKCHRKRKGKSYPSVYGRMKWDEPSPTITTQFFGFGNGRFGHPEQNRALSLREGAILQSFPRSYEFVRPEDSYNTRTIGRMIGNAVPVRLGKVVGETIKRHVEAAVSR